MNRQDIQFLNDLTGSFAVVHSMRLFPFDKTTVQQITMLLPVLLALTMISLEDLIKRLLGILL